MKVFLLNDSLNRKLAHAFSKSWMALLLLLFLGAAPELCLAEGSKDFVENDPNGKRLFLDATREQQFKVFVNEGEFINVGASHVGSGDGYINIYDPNGVLLDSIFNGPAGIIESLDEEMAGPTGGTGYDPFIRTASSSGIYTIVFGFPTTNTGGVGSTLNNNDEWQINPHQTAANGYGILAWDITVSTVAAANAGGTMVEGRLYTNEYIGVLDDNDLLTSPRFFVLTEDGYQYEVAFNNADPFRFYIFSNSFGIVDAMLNPLYKSYDYNDITQIENISEINSNSNVYYYEAQAEGTGGLTNNKIFFNLPNTDLPSTATVTDIFRTPANTHDIWLLNDVDNFDLDPITFAGLNVDDLPCSPGSIEYDKGGFFYVTTNQGGSVTINLDFPDPYVDLVINDVLSNGLDSIPWDGKDGAGTPIAVEDDFTFTYYGTIRFGEAHIGLLDVEGNPGGVTFEWLNAPAGADNDQFYYNHDGLGIQTTSDLISGGGPTPAPTNVPFMYETDEGDFLHLDQWFFVEYNIDTASVTVDVVIDCLCPDPVVTVDIDGSCIGDSLVLNATNSVAGIGDVTYEYSGPQGFAFTQVVGELETSTAVVTTSASPIDEGLYTIIATSELMCADTLEVSVGLNDLPNINSILGGGSYCPGDNVTLTAVNITAGILTIDYEWTYPDGTTATGTVNGLDDIVLNIDNIQASQGGTYSLTLTSDAGCVGGAFTVDVTVNPTPVLSTDEPTKSVCVNDDVQFCATNSTPGIGTMTCTWTGPNGFFSQESVGGDDDICLNLTNVDESFEGTYTLVCTFNGCDSAPLEFTLDVQPTPEINGMSPSGDFCVGDDVMFTAQNVTPGTGPIDYTWYGPSGDSIFGGTGPEAGPFPFTLEDVQLTDAGTYTLILTTSAGCESVPQTTTINVLPAPIVCDVTGGGDACVGQDVTLSAFNCAADVLPVTWTWTGPGGIVGTNTSNNDGPYEVTLTNVQLSDSGTYCITITSNANNCASEEVCVELNVGPGLNVIGLPDDSTYCDGTDVVLSGMSTLGSGTIDYSWTAPDGSTLCADIVNFDEPLTCTIFDLSPADTGIYIFNAESDAGCSFGPYEVYVGIYPSAEIVSVSGGGSLCEGDSVMLNGTGMGTATSVDYTWISPSGEDVTGSPSMGIPVEGPFPGLDTTPEAGTYTLTVTTPDGCTDQATVEVTLGCTPIAAIVNTDTTLCENDTLTLCGQNLNPDCDIVDYTWLTPNGITVTGTATGTEVFCDELLPLSTYGSGTYTLIINSGGCQSSAVSVEVTLNPNPIISVLSGNGTYCAGDTALVCFEQLNPAIDSFFYTCNIGTTQVTNVAATGDVVCLEITGNAGDTVLVFCSIESFEGCVSSLGDAQVIFDSGFDLTVTSNSPVCSNETLQLNGSNAEPCTGDVNYQWIDPMGDIVFTGTAPCEGDFPASISNPISGDYCLVVASIGSSCSDTACVSVVVNPAPEVVIGIDGGGTFCEGESTILTATIEKEGGGDIDYVWTLDGTPIDSGTASSGDEVSLDLGVLELDDSGEYCLELTCPANGCTNNPPSCTTVVVNPQPDLTDITGEGTYCEGMDVMLSASGTPGPGDVTYTWEGPNFIFSGTAPLGGPYDATITNIQQNQDGVYTLTVSSESASGDTCTVEETIVITVNPTPIVTIELDTLACEGDTTTITITIDPNNAASADWMLDGPSLTESGTVTELTTLTFTIPAMDGDTYTLSATSDQGCEADVATATVSTIQIPIPVLTVSGNQLCPGDPLQLTTQEQTGEIVTYCWFLDGVLIDETTDPILNIVDPVSGEYTVVAKVDNCDASSSPNVVTFYGAPDAVDDSYETVFGDPVSGNVTDNDTPNTGVTTTVVTEPTNGTLTLNSDGTFTYTPNQGFAGTEEFTYQICLIECPELCDEATVTIVVPPTECLIPNVITPNGDGTNDVLIINCVPFYPETNSLKIYNRWGDEIFVAEPYRNDWDGTIDGEAVPVSTYFYLFTPDRNTNEDQQAGYIRVQR